MTALARRALVAGASLEHAATAAATPTASADNPLNSPDAELLGACAKFLALHTEYITRLGPIIRSDDDIAGDAVYDFCDAQHWPREDELIDRITALPATTGSGLQAKASVLQAWLRRRVPDGLNETFEEAAECHELLAMSLANDILAGGAT